MWDAVNYIFVCLKLHGGKRFILVRQMIVKR